MIQFGRVDIIVSSEFIWSLNQTEQDSRIQFSRQFVTLCDKQSTLLLKTLKLNPHILYKPCNQQAVLFPGSRKIFQGFLMVIWESRFRKSFETPRSRTLKAWINLQMEWIDLLRNKLIVGKYDLRVWASIQTLKISFSYVTRISCFANVT